MVKTIEQDIYAADGKLLLAQGQTVVLNEANRKRLRRLGILDQVLYPRTNRENAGRSDAEVGIDVPATIMEAIMWKEIILNQVIEQAMLHGQGNVGTGLQAACGVVDNLIHSSKNETWYPYLSVLMNYVDWLYSHSINTALISGAIGTRLGYSEQRLKDLTAGALLHDVGQTVLPKSVLNKPSKLTEEEMIIMKNHCEMGASMLESTTLSNVSKTIILQHHEKKDGSGYPYGLSGMMILQESKIVALAEAFDTATTARPYKDAKPVGTVLEEMVQRPDLYDMGLVRMLMDTIGATL